MIVSDRGGPPEFVQEGIDGLIVNPNDAQALTSAIEQLVFDPVLAGAYGAKGRERLLENHQEERHYAGLMSIYEEASASSRSDSTLAPL